METALGVLNFDLLHGWIHVIAESRDAGQQEQDTAPRQPCHHQGTQRIHSQPPWTHTTILSTVFNTLYGILITIKQALS